MLKKLKIKKKAG